MRGLTICVAGVLLVGCGSSDPPSASTVTVTQPVVTTTQQSMASWKKQAADSVGQMGDALIATGDAMQAGPDFTAMREGCADLRAAADEIERQLPSPDAAVNAGFGAAVDNYRSASQLCMTMGPASDVADIASLRRFMDAGEVGMNAAFEAMGLNTPG